MTLICLWQGIAKRDLALGGPLFWGAAGVPDGQWFSVGLKEHMDYWTPENTDAYWPRPYLDKGVKNHQVQSRYLQNGAYLQAEDTSIRLYFTLQNHAKSSYTEFKGLCVRRKPCHIHQAYDSI